MILIFQLPGIMKLDRQTNIAALDSSALAGFLLLVATVLALVVSNSSLAAHYERLLAMPLELRLNQATLLHKPLLHWINDGLMAVFFLFVGLEIKRELCTGSLSTPRRALLPIIAAVGGMAIPALIYVAINRGDAVALRGWAIPTATDIAFALGFLALLGSRVPIALKIFVSAVAVLDDLGAIIVIALFYTEQLSTLMLAAAGIGVVLLALLNRLGVRNLGLYLFVGLWLWFAVLKSGVHATLAGVVVAMFVPLAGRAQHDSPLETLEQAIKPWVLFLIVPLFAFANAGVDLRDVTPAYLLQPITLGIAAGLVIGKLLGVVTAVWIAVSFRIAQLPPPIDWHGVLGIGLLCGIGFTMSLFIGTLAFEFEGREYLRSVRLGVLLGSAISASMAIWVLRRWLAKLAKNQTK